MRFHPWWPTNGRAEPGGICHSLAAPTAAPNPFTSRPQWGLLLLSKTAIDRRAGGPLLVSRAPARGEPPRIQVLIGASLQICYSSHAKVVLHLIPGSSSGNWKHISRHGGDSGGYLRHSSQRCTFPELNLDAAYLFIITLTPRSSYLYKNYSCSLWNVTRL